MTSRNTFLDDTGDIQLAKHRVFRETDSVRFHDLTIEGSNGLDLVEHTGRATSPPLNAQGEKQWYIHKHQTDNNRVIQGQRLFELYFDGFEHPHWLVFLTPDSGALRIPPNCYHRSVSCKGGSLLLNHAIRDEYYDENEEFHPATVHPKNLQNPWCHGITLAEAQAFLKNGEL